MINYTIKSVVNQTRAMNSFTYRIGVFSRKLGTMQIFSSLSVQNLLDKIPFLKFKNASGFDIFISPDIEKNQPLILVDDIDITNIHKMKLVGYNPACITETSPMNFQAWLLLGTGEMAPADRKIASRWLAEEFGGDLGCVGACHFGRLSGFTNQKPKHLTGKGYPFIKCRESTGIIAPKGSELMAWASAKRQKEAININNTLTSSKQQAKTYLSWTKDPNSIFETYFAQWEDKTRVSSKPYDLSRGDFAVACRMLKDGFTVEQIADAMIRHSPDIETRKANHVEDYSRRTVEAAAKRYNF
jgi:hypothetical protein